VFGGAIGCVPASQIWDPGSILPDAQCLFISCYCQVVLKLASATNTAFSSNGNSVSFLKGTLWFTYGNSVTNTIVAQLELKHLFERVPNTFKVGSGSIYNDLAGLFLILAYFVIINFRTVNWLLLNQCQVWHSLTHQSNESVSSLAGPAHWIHTSGVYFVNCLTITTNKKTLGVGWDWTRIPWFKHGRATDSAIKHIASVSRWSESVCRDIMFCNRSASALIKKKITLVQRSSEKLDPSTRARHHKNDTHI